MLAPKLRLLGLPVIECLLVLLYLTFALGLDERGVMVGQMAHLIDTTLPVGCRSHLDRIEMRGQPFATVIAVHTGQAGAQDGTGGEHAHVALAYVGIVTDRFADDWRQLLQEVVRKAGRLLPKLLPFFSRSFSEGFGISDAWGAVLSAICPLAKTFVPYSPV